MSTEEVELEGLDFIFKFIERAYIAGACISDGREIPDADYDVLEQIYRIEKEGRLVFYKTVCNEVTTNSTQVDLFSDNPSVS